MKEVRKHPNAFGALEAETRNGLLGTWKLVSAEETMKDGTTRPFPAFGPHAKGFLMYQPDGYMCALITNTDRNQGAGSSHPAQEENAAVAQGNFFYCGRYEIDVKRQAIIHLPEIAAKPGYVGSRQLRPWRFEGARMIFSDLEKNDPAVARWKIVRQKVL